MDLFKCFGEIFWVEIKKLVVCVECKVVCIVVKGM